MQGLAGRTAGGPGGKGESATEGSENNSCVADGRQFRLRRGNVSGAKGKEEEESAASEAMETRRPCRGRDAVMRLNKPSTTVLLDCCHQL